MSDCVVKQYCLSGEKRGECRKCKEYNKFERKKSKSRQATGRSNKRKGKESEKKLLLHFQRQGFDARIIEGSGAYKKVRGEGFDSDLRVTIKGKERKVENKKYGSKTSALARIRKLIGESGILYIKLPTVKYAIVGDKLGFENDLTFEYVEKLINGLTESGLEGRLTEIDVSNKYHIYLNY